MKVVFVCLSKSINTITNITWDFPYNTTFSCSDTLLSFSISQLYQNLLDFQSLVFLPFLIFFA